MSKNIPSVEDFLADIKTSNQGEPIFCQAVQEVMESIIPFVELNPEYGEQGLLKRMCEPDRIISFRVSWVDDSGDVQVNRGWRVQFNNAIGPYKGGIRLHPTVNQDILKFLAFEQCFKNSLTNLPMGGGKGGSNFDPKGKSDGEVMRFCQSFMTELSRYIGEDTDVPAGDIGIGAREIGFLFGQYKRMQNRHVGVITGKDPAYGGSKIRPEATGYGVVYFLENMLSQAGGELAGKTIVVSGSGNVALHAVEKANSLGAKVVSVSDSSGFIYDKDGINDEKLEWLKDLKFVKRGRISEYAEKFSCEYSQGSPWGIPCDVALPCATQNELNEKDAKELLNNGIAAVVEGANMPVTAEAVEVFIQNKVLFAPGKASNAGGVAVSGLEQSQNSIRMFWPAEEVDIKLRDIMANIHQTCVLYGSENGHDINYVKGANIGGFIKIAKAMLAQGVY